MTKKITLFTLLFFFTGCYSVVVRDNDPSYTYFKTLQEISTQSATKYLDDLSDSEKEEVINERNNAYGLGVVAITVYMKKPALIKTLIGSMGADVDQIGAKGLTALHIAANIEDLATLKLLLDTYKAKPSLTTAKENLLHIATQTPENSVVAELIKRFPEMVNQKDDLGNTPLFYAVRNRDIKTVRLLKKAKANPKLKNKEGITPLDYSIDMNYDSITKILQAKR